MRGHPYYNLYKGQADLWFMEQLGYDAMCLGNHEFDDGVSTLSDFVSHASFPILCANFDFSNEAGLAQKPLPWTIIEKDGQRYGIFGLTTQETAETSSPGANIVINDPVAAAKKAVAALQAQGITKIIALTHLGWEDDLALAAQVAGIDIIVGGHTGTVPDNYPEVVSTNGATTLVVQAGDYMNYLGRLDVVFDKSGVLQSWQGELIPVADSIQEDAIISAKLAEYKAPVSALMNDVIGQTDVLLDGETKDVRSQETNLGDMIADAVLAKAGATGATIAIVNSGGIRASIPAGDVTLGQVMQAFPYENYMVVVDVSGEQLIAALENGVSQAEETKGRFPQVSGLRFTWDPNKSAGSRITRVEIKTGNGYIPIDASASYRVVINDFMYQGGDGYTVFQQGTDYVNAGFIYYEILADYIKHTRRFPPTRRAHPSPGWFIIEIDMNARAPCLIQGALNTSSSRDITRSSAPALYRR